MHMEDGALLFHTSASRYIPPSSLSNFPQFDLVPILGFGLEMGVVPGFIYWDWISSGFWVLIPFDLVFFSQNQVCVVCRQAEDSLQRKERAKVSQLDPPLLNLASSL